jgi:hypothetical protein
VAALLVALASCAAQPAAPPSTTTTTSSPTSTVATTSPRIDVPRNLAGVDPCKLFSEADFTRNKYGPFSVPPAPYQQIPGSCAATVDSGGPDDLVVLVGLLPRAYDAEKANNPNGHQGLIGGHHVWFSCGGNADNGSCAAWASIAPDHALMVSLGGKNMNESRLLLNTQELITNVIDRIPRAS